MKKGITAITASVYQNPIYYPRITVKKKVVNFFPYNDNDAIVLLDEIVRNTQAFCGTVIKHHDVQIELTKAGLIQFYFPNKPASGVRASTYLLKNHQHIIDAINKSVRKAEYED